MTPTDAIPDGSYLARVHAHLDKGSDYIISEAERDILVFEAHIASKRALIKMVQEADAKRGRAPPFVVHIPAGNYIVSSPIEMTTEVIIQGAK